MSRVIVFDVNETLLDLRALDPVFESAFVGTGARQEWFALVLQLAMAMTLSGAYASFSELGDAALTMLAERRGAAPPDTIRWAVAEGMRQLPPHPEVPAALQDLRAAGFRLAALTNNPSQVVEVQFANAALREHFSAVLSVDAVRRFKPAPEPYQMAASRLGVPIGQIRLVACHSWDVAGALRAGAAAAFVARPGMVLNPLAPRPDIIGPDLRDVAGQIIRLEHSEMATVR